MALTLQITRDAKPVTTAPLRLTVAEAERSTLRSVMRSTKKTVPGDAPECHKSIQYPGGRQRF
ncbi:hypothetical protein [Streptomyces nigrescens]|uniref:hypothetical protein n=1 Tax=Streptomyces nigrescens TaxID=1920 RepID=UPI00347A809F